MDLIVTVGSENPTKINATVNVFNTQFIGNDIKNNNGRLISKIYNEIKVYSYEIESNVSSTPRSDEECIKGAIYRAKMSIKKYKEENQIDNKHIFGVGLEAGISEIINPETNNKLYFLCTWAAVLYNPTQDISYGCSVRAPISTSLLQSMSNTGKEMKHVLSDVSGIKEIAKKKGGIHLLTDGKLTRQQLNEEALYCALSKFTSLSCIH